MIWWNCLICARSFYSHAEVDAHLEVYGHRARKAK